MSDLDYPCILRPLSAEEGGGWLAEFPDLPGCIADGETRDEALREAEDAARSWIETAQAHGDPIPSPSGDRSASYSGTWLVRAPKFLHRRMAERAKEEGVSLNALSVTFLAEAVGASLSKPSQQTAKPKQRRKSGA